MIETSNNASVLQEGHYLRSETVEKMLEKPETPEFDYKLGVNGFIRGDLADNFRLPDFSYAPNHGEGRFLYRVKPYTYWHPADWLDIHAEGQGYGYIGGSQEYNKVSLYQGFAEIKLPGKEIVALKGGRQEFSYGSTFILGPDAFYDGLSFDAARLRLKPTESFTLDLILGSYATPFSGGMDGDLAGAYATYAFREGNAIELYAFRDTGSFDHHVGEYLAIWGARGTVKRGPLSLEIEPVYESGRAFNNVKMDNDRIDAFGGHLDAMVETPILGINNRFFLSYAYGSGSSAAANNITSAREFRNPNNDTPLIGDMVVIGDLSGVTFNGHHASGVQAYTFGWGADIAKGLSFNTSGHYFLANNVEDGFSRNLGIEADFTLTYAITDNFSLIAGYDRFFTAGFFRDAGGNGRDIDYGYLMCQFDLSHARPKLRSAGK
jgi:hypothetical protein